MTSSRVTPVGIPSEWNTQDRDGRREEDKHTAYNALLIQCSRVYATGGSWYHGVDTRIACTQGTHVRNPLQVILQAIPTPHLENDGGRNAVCQQGVQLLADGEESGDASVDAVISRE